MSDTEPRLASADPRMTFVHLRAALAREAIQAYILLNGAAAAALLSFLGSLTTQPATHSRLVADLSLIKLALISFTTGVALSASVYVVAFVVHTYHIGGKHSEAEWARRIGIAMNVLALALFVVGNLISARAITLR